MKKCLVIGAAMLDIIVNIDSLPHSGEDVYFQSQDMAIGGCAYNVADILKHFGNPYTLFAPVGKGPYADIIRNKLADKGHTSSIQAAEDNGYCMCIVEANGERTFLTLPGAECRFEKEWFENLNTDEYDCVYVSGYEVEGEGGDHIIDFLEKHPEMTLYYAPGPRITYIEKSKQQRIFNLNPVLHLNDKEAKEYTEMDEIRDAARELYNMAGNTVIITLGAEGVYLKNGEDETTIPSNKVRAIDTIGAGDSHIGAIIAMRQKGADFTSAIKMANKVSARVVLVQGPTLTDEEFEMI
ncbi:MAG: bifunctional hydroxymethylpyrimidine kinase/phosphomethylpyrimidine kinase [Eubacterium sp.]|nr:bifunctional hydroxymethylpyrimidine kinase/phosphomethylpyrimidine kinase [Eubacterium sp.]